MTRLIVIHVIAAITAFAFSLTAATPEFEARANKIIDLQLHPNGPGSYSTIAARLKRRQDLEWCSNRLIELLAVPPTGDMFWMFPVTAIAYLDRGQLSPAARIALRRSWKTYMPYRGDTENHWLLYYTSLYLMAQLWPDEPGSEWYNGRSSAENLQESKEWIEGWVKLTTTRGQGEYDSPHYMAVYLLPMSYLAAWASDPAMKKRATMMLDYLIADYAPENLDGIYVGAQSRVYDAQLLEKSLNVANDFGWLWFGLGKPLPSFDGFILYYTLASGYEPPEILKKIATDRSQPYTHYERKRTRNRWRFEAERHGNVYKTTYVRREYAVSSDQGGVLQPIQQHSWDVTWSVPDAKGVQNTLFTLNPHSSIHELQTYFTFPPDVAVETVVRSKKMYDSPDKFSGGSPYEKIFQDRDSVIVLYDIPDGARFSHVNGFFSKDLSEVVEDKSGWIFARGGNALIACRPLRPYSWMPIPGGGRRLFSPYPKNGMVVQVAAASEFASMQAFQEAIRTLPLEFSVEPTPAVRFRSLRGADLRFIYGGTPSTDGKPLDREHWPLFGGPFLEAAVDSERLTIKYGAMLRELDFRALTVKDN